MATLSKHHEELTNGVGKCSCPMWGGGVPSGFCDKPAYSKRPKSETWYNHAAQKEMRKDGRYNGYLSGLACIIHGGDAKEVALNLCDYCDKHIAECGSNPKFGTGIGNDNIYECDSFSSEKPSNK